MKNILTNLKWRYLRWVVQCNKILLHKCLIQMMSLDIPEGSHTKGIHVRKGFMNGTLFISQASDTFLEATFKNQKTHEIIKNYEYRKISNKTFN